jgi:glyoxylase-like metal-dependent hydrolase (beta-lactamase superfamily II)
VRAVSLHRDVIVATSRLLQTNCTVVRGTVAGAGEGAAGATAGEAGGTGAESFVIDSPILPDELELLPALLEQAAFPAPSGLLATHADWDHLLAPLAFPRTPLGCAESSAARLAAEPGAAQRELRAFDEELYVRRDRPLSLAGVQPLPVPGRCGLGDEELELHPAPGHTGDGMAVLVPWAGVLVAGDYLSAVEIPTLGPGGDASAYLDTLGLFRALLARAERVVPGHGPLLERADAERVLDEDAGYVRELQQRGAGAALPPARRTREQRRLHEANAALLER